MTDTTPDTTPVNKFDMEYMDGVMSEYPKVKVIFEKKDNTLRTMLCTNNFDLIPEEHHPKPGTTITEPSPTIRKIFDLEANGWRSFAYDRIKSVEEVE